MLIFLLHLHIRFGPLKYFVLGFSFICVKLYVIDNATMGSYVINMSQMCGPTGVGFLYGKADILNAMPPFLGKNINHIIF